MPVADDDQVSLRGYVDALFLERRRVFEVELEQLHSLLLAQRQHVDTVFHEKERAATVADAERSKAAEVLRRSLEATIKNVHDQLFQHIAEQVKQIHAAMSSAKELSAAQDTSVRDLIQAQLVAARESAEKLEKSNEKRFDAVNAFREQLADQAATFVPREVYETSFGALQKQVNVLTGRIDIATGNAAGTRATFGILFTVATIVISIIVLLANHTFS
ncbi:MAG: hypothetical protein H0X39_00205 [Actinobacteria bacterium]|nr:hypothetical protein [Actinomycetota bacterium]